MTPAGIASLARIRTKTDSTMFPDSELLVYMNIWLQDFARKINDANEDYFGMVATTDLIQNQRSYALPSDTLNAIKMVEVQFTADGDSIPLIEIDLSSERRPTSEEDIIHGYNNTINDAAYDIYANSLVLYTGTISETVEDGIKLHYFVEPDALVNVTENSIDLSTDRSATGTGFPKAFHELLARRIAMEYKDNAQQPISYSQLEQKFEFDFQKALDGLKGRNKSRAVIARVPSVHGTNSNNTVWPLDTGDNMNNNGGYNL